MANGERKLGTIQKSERTTVSVPTDDDHELERIAEMNKVSVARVVRQAVVAVYITLMLLILIVFGQVKDFEFISMDDNLYVTENPLVWSGLQACCVRRSCR